LKSYYFWQILDASLKANNYGKITGKQLCKACKTDAINMAKHLHQQ